MATTTDDMSKNSQPQVDSGKSGVACHFPQFKTDSYLEEPATIDIELSQLAAIRGSSIEKWDGISAAFRSAWALVLGCYTGQADISFGYEETSDFDTLSSFRIARVVFDKTTSIEQIVKDIRSYDNNGTVMGRTDFNTFISFHGYSATVDDNLNKRFQATPQVGHDKVSSIKLISMGA